MMDVIVNARRHCAANETVPAQENVTLSEVPVSREDSIPTSPA